MLPSRSATFLLNRLRPALQNCTRLKSSGAADYQEITIPVPWGHVAGKWWGPTDKRPILTLHGWQDNCGSFNRLIPLLSKDVGFLAIDFPGHGYSSRIPSGLYNYFVNYTILVRHIIEYFNWPKVSLLGHSMGGMISYMHTMLFPKDVDFLICIELAKPFIMENNVPFMAYKIDTFIEYEKHERSDNEPPSYPLEEIKKRFCAPNGNSIDFEHCHHLLERGIAPSKIHPDRYYFTRDPRLRNPALLNWPQESSVKFSKSITCPVLIVKGKSTSYYEPKENFYAVLDVLKKSSRDCVYERVEGKHHLHLNNPEETAALINCFIEKHDVEDRSVGGIRDEMKLKNCC